MNGLSFLVPKIVPYRDGNTMLNHSVSFRMPSAAAVIPLESTRRMEIG